MRGPLEPRAFISDGRCIVDSTVNKRIGSHRPDHIIVHNPLRCCADSRFANVPRYFHQVQRRGRIAVTGVDFEALTGQLQTFDTRLSDSSRAQITQNRFREFCGTSQVAVADISCRAYVAECCSEQGRVHAF